MDDLIEALTILRKYTGNIDNPTYCTHDELHIVGVDPAAVSDEDHTRLDKLGFFTSDGEFMSFRFGSA